MSASFCSLCEHMHNLNLMCTFELFKWAVCLVEKLPSKSGSYSFSLLEASVAGIV